MRARESRPSATHYLSCENRSNAHSATDHEALQLARQPLRALGRWAAVDAGSLMIWLGTIF